MFCYGKGGSLDFQSFTYDGAIAVITYTLAGKTKRACEILGVYKREFYWLKNDTVGLFNSYRTDIYDGTRLSIGVDGDRMHVGPTMWVGISALQYSALTGDLQFLDFAIDLVKWAQQLNHFTLPDGERGGVCMGYGWGADWANVYSTENNLDYYALLNMLDKIYFSGDPRVKNIFDRKNFGPKDIANEIHLIKNWLKKVIYDPKIKAFHCGYNEKGIDKTRALDTVTWAISAIGPANLKGMDINPFTLIDYAERKFSAYNNVEGETIKGFDFTDSEGRDRKLRLVWVEGTGQQIVAYQVLSRSAARLGFTERAEEYKQKARRYSDELEKLSNVVKLVDLALPYTCKRAAEREIIFTFKNEWEMPRGRKGKWVASLSSTIWRYFALSGFNPLDFDTEAVLYKLPVLRNN